MQIDSQLDILYIDRQVSIAICWEEKGCACVCVGGGGADGIIGKEYRLP